MPLELRVRLQDGIRSRIVTRRIHSIRARLIEGRLHPLVLLPFTTRALGKKGKTHGKPHIPRLHACDGNHVFSGKDTFYDG
jgi:hypothetical protein